jgi:polyribonucleotide nucleotidyltransferase
MDFKVAGTRDGITSIQMDIKIEGLDLQIMKEALAQAEGRPSAHPRRDGQGAAGEARRPVAVRAAHRHDDDQPEKIGDLIGPKGKTIRGIRTRRAPSSRSDDSGLVTIAAVGGESMERARQMVQALTAEPWSARRTRAL